jgi:hypothetical protein
MRMRVRVRVRGVPALLCAAPRRHASPTCPPSVPHAPPLRPSCLAARWWPRAQKTPSTPSAPPSPPPSGESREAQRQRGRPRPHPAPATQLQPPAGPAPLPLLVPPRPSAPAQLQRDAHRARHRAADRAVDGGPGGPRQLGSGAPCTHVLLRALPHSQRLPPPFPRPLLHATCAVGPQHLPVEVSARGLAWRAGLRGALLCSAGARERGPLGAACRVSRATLAACGSSRALSPPHVPLPRSTRSPWRCAGVEGGGGQEEGRRREGRSGARPPGLRQGWLRSLQPARSVHALQPPPVRRCPCLPGAALHQWAEVRGALGLVRRRRGQRAGQPRSHRAHVGRGTVLMWVGAPCSCGSGHRDARRAQTAPGHGSAPHDPVRGLARRRRRRPRCRPAGT